MLLSRWDQRHLSPPPVTLGGGANNQKKEEENLLSVCSFLFAIEQFYHPHPLTPCRITFPHC